MANRSLLTSRIPGFLKNGRFNGPEAHLFSSTIGREMTGWLSVLLLAFIAFRLERVHRFLKEIVLVPPDQPLVPSKPSATIKNWKGGSSDGRPTRSAGNTPA